MPSTSTRDRIIAAAAKLFYDEGIRRVSVDAIAGEAGVTKRTLYYHFESKDDLVAAYLEGRDRPNFAWFQRWYAEAEGPLPERIRALFHGLSRAARHEKWKGCGFLRTAAELANLPGHPAIVLGKAHKQRLEDWLCGLFEQDGIREPRALARQMVLLIDGAFAVVLLNRDPSYMETAGAAAATLVEMAPRAIR
ncbi:TetR/AcrR family transcriptional regulator [Ciceribacter sp. L1K22]|uniref:TetR/AcrR family transcriptional regulator n=1 Tax=Ciceribacter sp. L1K22 TaxID=2820275 RepID=UPI001ABE3435|nr:TetR/AcrR family transcriptional regulator [Ciceribacter sp. L1K22]MBO3758882.1 TetR/AcrR family transcriptional regulator [Ciceribacter sp. L1K22]